MIKHQLERSKSGSDNQDMMQHFWLSLFEILLALPIGGLDDLGIRPAIKADLHRSLIDGLKAERKEEIAARKFYERVKPLGPQGIGARRQYYQKKLRFCPDEREEVETGIVFFCGKRFKTDPRLDLWLAMVVDRLPVADYI